ncbi:MAG: hypothetical protein ACJ8F7_08560, partial [Gemmataceae bacterium]
MNRRDFFAASATLAALPALADDHPRSTPPPRSKPPAKKLAVVTTAYHCLSHAFHVCGRFLNGYLRDGGYHYPDFGIVGMHVEQQKANDLSRELAAKHAFRLFDSPAGALTLGGEQLAVDGVLLIAEHGDYPYNGRLQKLYPRFEMFQKIVGVFRRSGRVVPLFCDKHLSYDRKQAVAMVETARKMNFPLMAGSSLPVTWRRPEYELPLGAKIEQAVVLTRGEVEIFGFHGLEALQCMMERRFGGETGVKSVRCISGNAVWDYLDGRRGMWDLVEAALSRSPSRNNGDIRENCRQFDPPPGRPTFLRGPIAFLIDYADGTHAAVLILNGHVDDTTFAAKLAGEAKPVSTLFYLPPPPGAAFLEALAIRVEDFLNTGKPPYPVERTLLTSAVLDTVLESRQKGGREITLDVAVKYEAPKDSAFA